MCVACEPETEVLPPITSERLAADLALLESRVGPFPRCPDCNGITGNSFDMGTFYTTLCCSCDARRVEGLMLDLTGPSKKRRRKAMREVKRLRRRFHEVNRHR